MKITEKTLKTIIFEVLKEAIEDEPPHVGPPEIIYDKGGVQIISTEDEGVLVVIGGKRVAQGFFDRSADAFFMEKSSKAFDSREDMARHYAALKESDRGVHYRYPLRTISPDEPTPNPKLSPEDPEFKAILSMIEDFDNYGHQTPDRVIAKVNEIYETIQEMGYSFYRS